MENDKLRFSDGPICKTLENCVVNAIFSKNQLINKKHLKNKYLPHS